MTPISRKGLRSVDPCKDQSILTKFNSLLTFKKPYTKYEEVKGCSWDSGLKAIIPVASDKAQDIITLKNYSNKTKLILRLHKNMYIHLMYYVRGYSSCLKWLSLANAAASESHLLPSPSPSAAGLKRNLFLCFTKEKKSI